MTFSDKLNRGDIATIIHLWRKRLSYNRIRRATGYSLSTISKYVEAYRAAQRKKGRWFFRPGGHHK